MSALTSLLALLEGGSTSLGSVTITAGELKAGLAGLKSFPLEDLQNAVAAELGNVADDFVVAEDLVTLAGDVGVPDTAVIVLGLKVLAWVAANNTQGRPHSQTPMPNSGARGSSGVGGGRIPEEQAGLEDGA